MDLQKRSVHFNLNLSSIILETGVGKKGLSLISIRKRKPMAVTTEMQLYDWIPLLDVTAQAVLSENEKSLLLKNLQPIKDTSIKTFNWIDSAELNSEQYKQL